MKSGQTGKRAYNGALHVKQQKQAPCNFRASALDLEGPWRSVLKRSSLDKSYNPSQ